MSNKMWEALVEHAKTCVLSGKYYIYYSDGTGTVGAIFNNIYAFCGLISDEQFYSSEGLDDNQKVSIYIRNCIKGSLVHVAPACAGSGEGSDHFGSYVRNISLHFCKRLFPGLELMTSWSQGNNFTAAPGLPFLYQELHILTKKVWYTRFPRLK
jgi:hypothetical protein